MSASLPLPNDCCNDLSCTPLVQNIPGPQGPAGPPGTPCVPCSDGVSAFTTTTSSTTMPAVSATVIIAVVTSAPFVIGENIFVQFLGYMLITAISDSTHITAQNLGYPENAAPTTVAGIGARVAPSGSRGSAGSSGAGGATGPQGIKGDKGDTGNSGVDGKNAYTALTSNFTMPAIAASGTAVVGNSDWATIGQVVFLQGAGTLQVTAKPSSTQVTLLNPAAYTANVAGGTVIASPATISPSGLIGPSAATPLTQIASGLIALPTVDGTATPPFAHGFAGVPQWVRWVLRCSSGELNYSAGDEVNLQSAGCTAASDNTTRVPEIADATNLQVGAYLWATNPLRLADKVAGTNSVITPGNWRLKAYASHY